MRDARGMCREAIGPLVRPVRVGDRGDGPRGGSRAADPETRPPVGGQSLSESNRRSLRPCGPAGHVGPRLPSSG